MFRCDFCGELARPKIKPIMVVTARKSKAGSEKGLQIAKEAKACPCCAKKIAEGARPLPLGKWVPVLRKNVRWIGVDDRLFWRNQGNSAFVAVLYQKPIFAKKPFVATFECVHGGIIEHDNIPIRKLPPHPEA